MILPSILCSMLSYSQITTLVPACRCLKMTFWGTAGVLSARVGREEEGRRTMGCTITRCWRPDTVGGGAGVS